MKRIVVTSTSCPDLEFEAIEIQHLPLLQRECISFDPPPFDTAVFYSKNGVSCARQNGLDLRGANVWAVGDSTADRLRSAYPGVEPHVPTQQTFEGLVKALKPTLVEGSRVLSIELEEGPRSLEARLEHDVQSVVAYRTVLVKDPSLAGLLDSADALIFASPRAVEAYAAISDHRDRRVGSIGPTTTVSLLANGFSRELIVESNPPDLNALLVTVAHQLLDG